MNMHFTLFPAIDLHNGRCVRLQQGRLDAETVFSDNPTEIALHWVEQGAEWLHVVNLDGAFQIEPNKGQPLLPPNLRALADIAKAVNVPIQFGGGLRTLEDIQRALDLGARRVILGSVAVTNPDLVRQALRRYGAERIVVGLDAREGKVAIHGWAEVSELSAEDLGRSMYQAGVRYAVYTDIRRDGMLTGVDVEGTAHLARTTGLRVIASGGIASLDDIRHLLAVASEGVIGAIIGQALYTGHIHLPDALQIVQASNAKSDT